VILHNGIGGIQAVRDGQIIGNPEIEVIRDGDGRGRTYYNRAPDTKPRVNYCGYTWDQPQSVLTLVYNPGMPEEWGGWFTSLEVQYQDERGEWR
jgi:hypothetical protein